MRCHAVGGHHVETYAGQQGNTRRSRLRIQRVCALEYVDLAGDVEVMGAGAQAGGQHRRGRVDEWPGGV